MKNKKYEPNKKNGGQKPPVNDSRTLYVQIKCENCIECRKQKAREWSIRLQEDIREHTNGKFVAFTFSNASIKKIITDYNLQEYKGYELDNKIATIGMRLFLGRWRKQYKKSLRHWIVTELGHEGTENIHMHGIIWTDVDLMQVEKIWQYGFMWKGKRQRYSKNKEVHWKITNYVNEQTINYIIKYVHKTDPDHKYYKSKILTTPGIGKNYMNRTDILRNKFKIEGTDETYKTRSGKKITLPTYYRNKIYNDAEKEELWLQKLDNKKKWICGDEIDISKGEREYFNLLKYWRRINWQMGYRGYHVDQERKAWEEKKRQILTSQRTA